MSLLPGGKHHLSFKIDETLHRNVRAAAWVRGWTMAAWIRRALYDALDRQKREGLGVTVSPEGKVYVMPSPDAPERSGETEADAGEGRKAGGGAPSGPEREPRGAPIDPPANN